MFPIAANLVVSAVTFAIGIFFSTVPDQAAQLWGRRRLADLNNGPTYRRLYRATGILLCLAGLFFAADSILSIP